MSDIVTINITQQVPQPVTITVNEVLGADGEQGPAGADGTVYEDGHEEFTGSTSLTLTTAHNYVAGSGCLYKNGARLLAASFTEATANTITLNVARLADDEFIFDYKYLA